MKVFAVVLLCFFAVVQGRSTGAQVFTAAALGENPWVVHLRTAVSTSGRLNSCIGTLVSNFWVLTTATCVRNARFVWIRYGSVDVTRPELVTETSTIRNHPEFDPATGDNDIALVSINRYVESTDNISPAVLADAEAEVPSSGKFCGYGAKTATTPGEILNCYAVDVEESEDGSLVASSEDGVATQFDIGAALTNDGVLYGVLTDYPGEEDSSAGKFLNVGDYKDWISSVTGVASVDDGFGSDVIVVN